MMDSFVTGINLLAIGSAGTGKAQPIYSKILTINGWKTIGELNTNDIVITPKGVESRILKIFDQGDKDVYRITFKDGTYTDCTLEHLWEVYVPKSLQYRRYSNKKIIQTSDIIEILNDKSQNVNISIDYVDEIEFPPAELNIDPYILGCILGDGNISQKIVSISSSDLEIINNISSKLEIGYELNKKVSDEITYILRKSLDNNDYNNAYVKRIKNYGLLGKLSYEKFIPEIYIRSSIEQRKELLRGLLDTDGTVGKGCITYCTTSKILAKQVQEIILSIGGKCTISEKPYPFYYDDNKNKVFGKPAYILHIKTKNDKELFSIDRKKQLASNAFQKNQYRRIIKKVEKLNLKCQCKCILIEDESHLYITDNYIITHNTFLAIYLALKNILSFDPDRKEKILFIRSAVPTRNVGFLPGSLEEKNEIYALPFKQIINQLCENGTAWEILLKKKLIDFQTTSYLRELTFDNTIIIVDELQSMDEEEMKTILTRIGENTQVILCGDSKQNDLFRTKEKSCFNFLQEVTRRLPDYFDVVNFLPQDIVRSGFVKQLILVMEDM